MKSLLALLILLAPDCLPAQSYPAVALHGSNTIVVTGTGYSTAIRTVLDSGYYIANHDNSLQFFITQPRTDFKNGINYQFFIRFTDSVAYVTGEWTSTLRPAEHQPAQAMGWRSGAFMITWQKMELFARLLGPNVSYLKK